MEKQTGKIKILHLGSVYLLLSTFVFGLVMFCQFIVYPLIFSYSVKGKEHLKGIQKAVLVSNHSHYLDPGFIGMAFWPRKIYFTVLEKTFRRPFLSRLIRLLRSFPIPDQNPGVIVRAIGTLFKEKSVFAVHFFPEGVMTSGPSDLKDFMPGAFSIANFFQVPIIPVTEVITKRKLLPPKITIYIEKPIYPERIKQQKDIRHLSKRERITLVALSARSVIDSRMKNS